MPTGLGDDTIAQFNTLVLLHTDVARIPPTDAYVCYSQDQVFGPLGMLGPTLAGVRDMLGARLETEAGTWSYPSGPNVTAFYANLGDPSNGDSRASLPLADVTPAVGAHPLVLSGVLDAVAEQVLLAPEFRGDDPSAPDVVTGPSVAGVFAAVATVGQTLTLVTSPDDLDMIPLDPLARSRLEADLAAGQIVVIPVKPVDLGGSPVLGWWIVDPATGRTRDELQSGLAGASTSVRTRSGVLFGNSPGYTFLVRAIMWVAANARWFACLGLAAGAAFVFTGAMIGLADTAAAGGSLAKMALAGALAGGAIAGATIGCIG